MKRPYLECGRIINTHGFRGTVKLESWCDTPSVLAGLPTLWFCEKDGYRPVRVLHASVFKQFVLCDLEGISDEAAADRLRGTVVFAAREDLPIGEDDFFIADLLGLPVKDADSGVLLGALKDVNTSGARDLYVIKTVAGREALVPAVAEFVIRVDTEDAIYIRPIPGLLGEDAE